MSFLNKISQALYRSANQHNIKICLALSETSVPARHTHSFFKTFQSNHNCKDSNHSFKTLNSTRFLQNHATRKHYSGEAGGDKPEISTRISGLVSKSDIVVFMKGVPSAPRCGFSNAVCQIFRMHNVEIDAHDVLEDEELRQGIKEFSNWPTIPQVYFKGEFIGGCDILLQMHQSGELIEELDKIGIKSALVTEEEKK